MSSQRVQAEPVCQMLKFMVHFEQNHAFGDIGDIMLLSERLEAHNAHQILWIWDGAP